MSLYALVGVKNLIIGIIMFFFFCFILLSLFYHRLLGISGFI